MKENDLIFEVHYYILDFTEHKSRILKKYQEALDQKLVDTDMIEINHTINKLPEYVTTSSCTGRITIISKTKLRSKYNTVFHLKTHNPNEFSKYHYENLQNIDFDGELWLLVESPNVHIRCHNLENAENLHQIALQSKLSKSKFQSISPAIVVEILGTGSIQVPLGSDGKILISKDHFRFVVIKSVELLHAEQKRLFAFHKSLLSE